MGGFQFLLILDLWDISFHAVVFFVLSKNFLFKSALGHCVLFTYLCGACPLNGHAPLVPLVPHVLVMYVLTLQTSLQAGGRHRNS